MSRSRVKLDNGGEERVRSGSGFDVRDATYHVVHRGINGQACFFADEDCQFYLSRLKAVAVNSQCDIHAYVLMPDYVQLLATARRNGALARMMGTISKRYAQHVNYVYGHGDAVWERRYRASLVGRDDYVLRCYRFIELHPVRMGSADHPDDYPWSSYCANATGSGNEPIKAHAQYEALGRDAAARQTAYRKLCSADLREDDLEEIKAALISGRAIGTSMCAEGIDAAL